MVATSTLSTSPVCRSPLSQHSFRADSPAPVSIVNDTTPKRQSITLSPRRLSTSRSLAGSYTLSLLSSRMSAAHPTHFVPSAFTLKIGSVSPSREVPTGLKCPPHVKIAFDARWHSLEDSGREGMPPAAAAWTPWVGNVDVERWYEHLQRQKTLEWARAQCASAVAEEGEEDAGPDIDAYYERILKGWIPSLEDVSTAPSPDRALLGRMRAAPCPGYELGVCGKLQLFIMQTVSQPMTTPTGNPTKRTEQTTPVKVFLVDYDLTSLVSGGRLLYKERAYQTIEEDPRPLGSPSASSASPGVKSRAREVLKYAFELHFLCVEKPKKARPRHDATPPESIGNARKRRREAPTTSVNPHRHRAYYLGKQIRLVFPTSSSSLNNTDGAATAQHQSTLPPVRVERLIEVQNPVIPDTNVAQNRATEKSPRADPPSVEVKLSESFASESWEGLHARWAIRNSSTSAPKRGEARRRIPNTADPGSARTTEDTRLDRGGQGHAHVTGTAASNGADRDPALVFTRSPTPVQPVSLKSPSLLTARLEEMSSLSPRSGLPLALHPDGGDRGDHHAQEQTQRLASPSGGRRRMLWPDDDTERLLSESLQKLPVSYR
ncbi:hypothetical protein NCC49_002315 [Naganishia albida]|nr:hypothetical protein NCC49_002315 [Naganishia albida]